MIRPIIDRFAEKVALDDSGCLLWIASLTPQGYGKIFSHKVAGRPVLLAAHRFSYEWHHGCSIPDGLPIDHLCRVPSCVNPAHLEAVTQAENVRRIPAWLRGRGGVPRQSHCNRGHPLSGENVYVQPKTGKRFCRECRDRRMREFRQRRATDAA